MGIIILCIMYMGTVLVGAQISRISEKNSGILIYCEANFLNIRPLLACELQYKDDAFLALILQLL